LNIPLKIKQKYLAWFPCEKSHLFEKNTPCFAFHFEGKFFYGFPSIDKKTIKIAEHFSGDILRHPSEKKDHILKEALLLLQGFIKNHLPYIKLEPIKSAGCLYTMTPDENFIIDHHPLDSRVVLAAGFSGHGFKFAPIVGRILSDLSDGVQINEKIKFLSLNRASLQ